MRFQRINDRLGVEFLKEATATTETDWIDISDYRDKSIEFSGIVDATLQVWSSNKWEAPSKDEGVQISDDMTANGIYFFSEPLKWIKIKLVSYSSGKINCYMVARS